MIKAVIFDMDGLIVDTEIIQSKALEQLLKNYGKKPLPYPNGLIHIPGEAGKASYKRLQELYHLTDTPEVLRRKTHIIFRKLLEKKLIALPGFFTLITMVDKNNFKRAVASSRFIDHIHLILENLDVKKYFDVIIGPDKNRRNKPHPDIFLDTANQLGVNPENCLVLEDSEIGIVAAHAAGMKVIAVPNEYTKAHNFSKADKVVNSLESVTMELINSL